MSLGRTLPTQSQSLVDHAKTLGVEFRANVTVDGLVSEFQKNMEKKK
jgi:hypothetical protein